MLKIEIVRDMEVGAARLVREERRTTSGVIENVTIELPPELPDGLDYWPIFVADGDPISPEEAVRSILDGTATLEGDFHEAHDILHAFLQRVRGGIGEQARYRNVLAAASYTDARRMESDLLAVLGYDAEDDLVMDGDRMFLTTEEVARLFRVNTDTVRRWAGSKLPASVKIGRKALFRTDAIATIVRNAGPKHAPVPVTPVKSKRETAAAR